ncbi:MAG: tetratricopeptide repeat protein [Phycisphaerales bacterium]|nr:tetratricopeptide repeat protein [Phycisphaerales bacterium]
MTFAVATGDPRVVLLSAILLTALLYPAKASSPAQDSPPPPGEAPGAEAPKETPPPAATFASAREAWIEGRYDRAKDAYAALRDAAASDADRLKASMGVSRALASEGKYREALDELRGASAIGESSADWHVALGQLSRMVGDYDATAAHARKAHEIDKTHAAARLLTAEIAEYLGRRDEAIEAYQWFDRQLVEREDLPRDAEWLTTVGKGFYRFSLLSRTDLSRRTKHALVELFQTAYERVDRSYWPARVAAADLLRSKYNNDETDGSVGDYLAALKINPHLPEAFVGIGEAALENWQFEEVERRVKQALEVNPLFAPAYHLLARCRIQERRYDDAIALADKALETNAFDLTALSLQAAAHASKLDSAALAATLARVEKINPRCAELYRTLGDALSALRDYDGSERDYLKAIDFEPCDPNPRTELGMMYMQWGLEDQARAALDAAWELDNFNQRTFNTLELLDSLQKFTRHETPHFIIRYEESTEPGLGAYLGEYLERIYPEVCGDYGVELHDKTVIEVFPTAQAFAVRITGKPWIFTVGACTGRVIALSAPRADVKLSGPYDIASVLKHEFTHTVTLAATDNRIPHWMTEGLAVHQEDSPRSFDWCQLLADAMRRDRLFTLESVNWGFIRPRHPNDRQLAYAQSEWMCEYIIERFGYDVINRMLTQFEAGRTQEQVFRDLLGLETQAFDKDFAAWSRKQAEGWGLDLSPVEDLTKLRALALLPSEDGAALGRLAKAELAEGNVEPAVETARKALEKNPDDVPALETLGASMAELAGESRSPGKIKEYDDEAHPLLQRLAGLKPQNWVAQKYLGKIALRRGQFDVAETHFKNLQRLCPLEPSSHAGLAAVYLNADNDDAALAQLLELAQGSTGNADVASQIARIYRRKQQLADAQHWYRRAIFMDLFSPKLHAELAELHQLRGQDAEALAEYEMLTRLQPDEAGHWSRAALTARKLGKDDQAQHYAREAVKRDPNSPAASLLNK